MAHLEGRIVPADATNASEFAALLRQVRIKANSPSYLEIEKRNGPPRSTASDIFTGKRLPKWAQVQNLLTACGVPQHEHAEWHATWVRISVSSPHNAPRPVDRDTSTDPGEVSRLHWSGESKPHRKIVLWGPPGSGKTCFLGALAIAASKAPRPWTLIGGDPRSADFISSTMLRLGQGQGFLPATISPETVRAVLHLETERTWRTGYTRRPIELGLEILDLPGAHFAGSMDDDRRNETLEWLSSAHGIVFFFDPVWESRKQNADEYFVKTAHGLAEYMQARKLLAGSRLPQNLAVCVSKYDDPEVLAQARRVRCLSTHPGGVPRVPDHLAKRFFEELAATMPGGGARTVDQTIRSLFLPRRIRYYATSSIGFYREPGKDFDIDDCYNICKSDSGDWAPRSAITPINVLEPLLAVHGRTR